MIDARGLVKRYGAKTAVDDLTFQVRPGVVTGFLGPNGSGKSTTMRLIIGLDAPTQGSVTVNGKAYAGHRAPLREVGSLLEAKAVHGGRSARNHLLALGATVGVHGEPGRSYTLESSDDLIHWTPIRTNPAPYMHTDPAGGNVFRRFYRTKESR